MFRNFYKTKNHFYKCGEGKQKFAILLTGCGSKDGTNTAVVSSIFAHTSYLNISLQCYAPENNLPEVFNHYKNEVDCRAQARSAFIESARMLKNNTLLPLNNLKNEVKNYNALIVPDSMGLIKSIVNSKCSAESAVFDVKDTLSSFHKAKIPIGLMGISALLAPFAIENSKITLGKYDDEHDKWPYRHIIPIVKELGSNLIEMGPHDVCVDDANLIYSTPSTLNKGSVEDIYDMSCHFIGFMYFLNYLNKNPL